MSASILNLVVPPVENYHDPVGAGIWQTVVSRIDSNPFNLIATIIFFLAIVHTFCTGFLIAWAKRLEARTAHKRRPGQPSFAVEALRFFGEVEVVFGLWVIPLVIAMTFYFNWHASLLYLGSRDFAEPLLVTVIMVLASTRPVLHFAERFLHGFAKLGGGTPAAWWLSLLTIGPFLGSLITEPGAMTITASLLARQFYAYRPSLKFAYATLGLLFVNISTGGDLTHFAAPPVLIVARKWDWNTPFMFTHFGWKTIVGIVVANLLYFVLFRKEFRRLREVQKTEQMGRKVYPVDQKAVPFWITFVQLCMIGAIVCVGHQPIIFIGIFLLFLAFHQATAPYQSPLRLRSSLLVGLFLMGLVIHGGLQGWWISPLLSNLAALPLLFLSVGLTSVNDNAAITYLSSLTPYMTVSQKYAVVAGAVSGGGLTVIANAPNPAGQQILSRHFPNGISPWRLFLGALMPTTIVVAAFVVFGTF